MQDVTGIVYKIVPASLWQAAREAGHFDGSPIDVTDGFIHFSTAAQAFPRRRPLALRPRCGRHWHVSRVSGLRATTCSAPHE